MKNQTISWRYVSIIIGILLLFAAYKFVADLFLNNVGDNVNQPTYIYIQSNESFDRLIYNLDKDHILKNVESFERVAKLLKLDDSVKSGRYKIGNNMSNLALVRLLKSGKQEPVNLVLKYARRTGNLASAISKQIEPDSTELMNAFNDTSFFYKIGFDSNNIISLFVPNTYNVYWNITPKKFMERMKREYDVFWNSNRTTKAILLKLSPLQVSTLASIVMSETNKVDEMPIVARAYLNRMQKGMPLQADPTVIFALHDDSIRRVLHQHTLFDSPYNTYLYKGLPPGPICMASPAAIDAVLNAPLHNYIYFCAKEDFSGYHNFAGTLEQHNVNARKYQRELSRRGIN
ncbi:MAG: endolytic transglycosylase MltG [Bacteroidota bacterium]